MKNAVKNGLKEFEEVIISMMDDMVDMLLTVLATFIFIIEGIVIIPIASITDSIYRRDSYYRVLKGNYGMYLMKINAVIENKIEKMEL